MPGRRFDAGSTRIGILFGLLLSLIPRGPLDAGTAWCDGVIAEINALRANHGVGPLRMDEAAMIIARTHAHQLARRRTLSHRSPDGRRVLERYRGEGGTGLTAGENLGAGDSVVAVIDGWMESASHRRNMLNPQWSALGVGFYPLEGGRLVLVAVFTGSQWSATGLEFPNPGDRRTARVTGTFYGQGEIMDPADLILRVAGEPLPPSGFQPGGGKEYRVTFDIPLPPTADPDRSIPAELIVRTGSRWRATDLFFLTDSLISEDS